MSVRVEPVRYRMAHRVDLWPRPRRWARVQYAAAVCVEAALLLGLMAAVLVVGLVLGAAVGVEMR